MITALAVGPATAVGRAWMACRSQPHSARPIGMDNTSERLAELVDGFARLSAAAASSRTSSMPAAWWNKVRMVKDPDSGKRISRPNAKSAWQRADVPELAIVRRNIFDAAQSRKETRSNTHPGQQVRQCGTLREGPLMTDTEPPASPHKRQDQMPIMPATVGRSRKNHQPFSVLRSFEQARPPFAQLHRLRPPDTGCRRQHRRPHQPPWQIGGG
jgi:hypothetical protein